LRKSCLSLFGRLVETSATADCRSSARELFALVHRRRAQAPGRAPLATFTTGTLQGVYVQVGVVDANSAAAAVTALTGGGDATGRDVADLLENSVVQVIGCQVALRMERLRLAADVRVRAVDAAHLVARTPLPATRRRPIGLLERSHLHAERRPQVTGRVRR